MRGMLIVAGVALLVVLVRSTPLPTPRWWQLGILAALLQVPAYIANIADGLLPISYVLLCLVAWRNRSQAGGAWICAGMLLNAAPILALGDMPISPEMLAWGGQTATLGAELPMSKDVVVERSAWLLFGDSIPIALEGYKAAWSIGDTVLCCGVMKYGFMSQRKFLAPQPILEMMLQPSFLSSWRSWRHGGSSMAPCAGGRAHESNKRRSPILQRRQTL